MNPWTCSLPGSSVHGIFQARVLEWVVSSSSSSSRPKDWTHVSFVSYIGRRILYHLGISQIITITCEVADGLLWKLGCKEHETRQEKAHFGGSLASDHGLSQISSVITLWEHLFSIWNSIRRNFLKLNMFLFVCIVNTAERGKKNSLMWLVKQHCLFSYFPQENNHLYAPKSSIRFWYMNWPIKSLLMGLKPRTY